MLFLCKQLYRIHYQNNTLGININGALRWFNKLLQKIKNGNTKFISRIRTILKIFVENIVIMQETVCKCTAVIETNI